MKIKLLRIGNKPLKYIIPEDILEIILIEGCHNVLEYWEKPVIVEFDAFSSFSDTIVLDYVSYQKLTGEKSYLFSFYLNFETFSFSYSRVRDNAADSMEEDSIFRGSVQCLRVESIKYLISKGYDIPIY